MVKERPIYLIYEYTALYRASHIGGQELGTRGWVIGGNPHPMIFSDPSPQVA